MSKPKMICPDCGAEMNHHAFKIDHGVDDPIFVDAIFGGASKRRIPVQSADVRNCKQGNKIIPCQT